VICVARDVEERILFSEYVGKRLGESGSLEHGIDEKLDLVFGRLIDTSREALQKFV
jgi:hypothetical protein